MPRQDVRLNIHPIANGLQAEGGDGEGFGDQGHLEPVVADRAHGQGHSIDGDRAFACHQRRQTGSKGETKHPPGAALRDAEQRTRSVDVTLHDVSAEAIADLRGAFEVHPRTDGGSGKGAHRDRFGHDVGGEPVLPLVHDGEADTAHGNGVAVACVGDDEWSADRQARGIRRCCPVDDLTQLFDDSGEHVYSLPVAVRVKSGRAVTRRSSPSDSTLSIESLSASPIVPMPTSPSARWPPPRMAGAR